MKNLRGKELKIEVGLIPNVGIGKIHFGMNREDIRKTMVEEYGADQYAVTDNGQSESYFEYSLKFLFEADGTLSFIETSSPPPLFVTLLGVKTWEIPGDELFKMLCKHDEMNTEISENGYNPIFKKTHITLYELDKQYDHIGNEDVPKWGCIGIGDERYYKSICDIYGLKD